MILSATQLTLATELLESSGYVRIVFESQEINSLAVTAKLGGNTYEISDLGVFQVVRVRPLSDPDHYYRRIPV